MIRRDFPGKSQYEKVENPGSGESSYGILREYTAGTAETPY